MKITLGTLKDKGEELATFLEPRVGTKPELAGDSIEIEDGSVREGVRPRQVKTYIKRFMYMNGVRKNYRVFVAGKELTIQEIELGEEAEKEKKAKLEAPAAPEAPEEPTPAEAGEAPEAKEEEAEEPKPEKPKKAAARKPRTTKKKKETKED